MTPRYHGLGERDSDHHGNLREALIAAVLELIAEHGPTGFSYADVARAAGVSPAAPYRRFRDRDALLAEVARRGFERFVADLEAAWNQGRPDPAKALEACVRVYLEFARSEPASFSTMFGPGMAPETALVLSAPADRAFTVLRRAAEAVSATYPGPNRPPALMVALHVWATAHGIASLFVGPGRWYNSGNPHVERHGCGWRRRVGRAPSGNLAFDDYRAETLRQPEDEQREFVE